MALGNVPGHVLITTRAFVLPSIECTRAFLCALIIDTRSILTVTPKDYFFYICITTEHGLVLFYILSPRKKIENHSLSCHLAINVHFLVLFIYLFIYYSLNSQRSSSSTSSVENVQQTFYEFPPPRLSSTKEKETKF